MLTHTKFFYAVIKMMQGAMSNLRVIDKDRTKVQCYSIVIAIHGYHSASLIMHHACVYYLLSDESISQSATTLHSSRDYLTRQNALSPSTYLDRLRSQECTPPASNCVGNSIVTKLSRHYSREPSRELVMARQSRYNSCIVNLDR